jgi:hypothetical protein
LSEGSKWSGEGGKEEGKVVEEEVVVVVRD